MAKHLSAFYYDQHQRLHEIKIEELCDPRKLGEAHGNRLFDASKKSESRIYSHAQSHFCRVYCVDLRDLLCITFSRASDGK